MSLMENNAAGGRVAKRSGLRARRAGGDRKNHNLVLDYRTAGQRQADDLTVVADQ
jgi:hypothetical protein